VQISQKIISFATKLREDHPKMGARIIYKKMQRALECQEWFPQIGRDKVESILLNNGFRIKRAKAYHRTTIRGYFIFSNLIKGLIINNLNQVWVSDITYYFIVEKGKVTHYYLTFIMDLFTRRILGFAVSDNLITENTTLPALQMALKTRNISQKGQLEGLIFHSDGGGQYADKSFLSLLHFFEIKSSMGKEAYENPNSERINGTIKNDYLLPWDVNSYYQLTLLTAKAVRLYNEEKPHSSLQGLSPVEFEQMINEI
jgi:transposase InsO family protein